MPHVGNNAGSSKSEGGEESKTLFAGAPPMSDDPTMQYVLNEMKEMKAKIARQENTIKSLSLGFKARYVDLGGDTLYYSNLGELRKRMRAICDDDQEVMKKFDAWARERNIKGNVRVALTMVGGAAIGAGIGGAITGAMHWGIVCGSAACAGIATAPAVIIVLSCVAGGLLIAFVGWGIYKLYQKHQIKKVKEDELEPEERNALEKFTANLLAKPATNAQ